MTATYIEIASGIRKNIKQGLLPLNSKISERKLAEEFGVGRSTITSALKILKDEGYVESNAKSGTIVCNKLSGDGAIWERLVHRGLNANSSSANKTAIKYLTKSGKKNVTFGFHDEFKPYEPLQKAFHSLSKKTDIGDYLNTFDEKGLPILRETLSKHLKNYGINASPDNIVVFHGYIEAIYAVAVSLLNRGTNFYCMKGDMMWGQSIVHSTGANMYEIPIDGQGPDAEQFEHTIKPGNNLLYVNPINSYPSMLTFSNSRMDLLIKTCVKHNIPILENDFLRDIWITPPPAPFKARNSDYVIYIGTMVNSYVTGVRCGWAVLPDYVVPRVCDVKLQMSTGGNSGNDLIINEILSKGYYYEFLENFRKKLPERGDKINSILSKHLSKLARWNPDNLLYMVALEFREDIDIYKIISENPYFIMAGSETSAGAGVVYTNVLGMSIEDFEELAKSCAISVKRQMKSF